MIALFLTIICSTSIAIILKLNSSKGGDTILLLTGNYFSAALISLVLFIFEKDAVFSTELIPLGMLISIIFVGSIFAFSKSVILSGAALSTVSSRLSVFVPIFLSIVFFNELPNTFQTVGLFLSAATIILFYFSINRKSKTAESKLQFIYLVAVLIGIGFGDFFMKVFQENWSSSEKPLFLFWIFFFSFLITLFFTVKQRKVFNKSVFNLGIILGLPNIFSAYFLIEALKNFSAVFVYPVVNISIIIGTSIIVKIFWKENWNPFTKFALLSGLIAILFLSL